METKVKQHERKGRAVKGHSRWVPPTGFSIEKIEFDLVKWEGNYGSVEGHEYAYFVWRGDSDGVLDDIANCVIEEKFDLTHWEDLEQYSCYPCYQNLEDAQAAADYFAAHPEIQLSCWEPLS